MPRSYSQDLRERVIGFVESGHSRRSASRMFGLSISCVVKWVQRFRQSGAVAAKPVGGRRGYALEGERVFVLGRVAEKPDLTLAALRQELAARGVRVSQYAVWNFLRREGLSFKKKPARGRTGPARRRKTA